jgi:hypothetical protein
LFSFFSPFKKNNLGSLLHLQAGVRTVKIESDFKNIFSIFLTGYITEGQNAEHLMRQVVHDYYSKIVATKQVRLYAAGNQSIELTIIGTI